MPTISSFRSIENKHDLCRGKDYMKIFFESFREHVLEIINKKPCSHEQKESGIIWKCKNRKEKLKNKYLK